MTTFSELQDHVHPNNSPKNLDVLPNSVDIVLQFGVDAKIQLDYWWERCPAVETVEETVSSCVGDVVRSVSVDDTPDAARVEETPAAASVEDTPAAGSGAHTPSLLSSLNKLLSIAKIEMSKPKVRPELVSVLF